MNNADRKIDYEKEIKARLKPHHIIDLQKSCLSDETIYKAGYSSDLYNSKHPSWSIELINPLTNRLWYKRYRLDKPFENEDGSTVKYLQPKNSGSQPYLSKQVTPEEWKTQLADVSVIRLLPEGEKKTDCAIQHLGPGSIAIGITGVNSWSNGSKQLNDFLDQYVALSGSRIIICVDSDYKTNPNIQKAIQTLTQLLLNKKVKVSLIITPGDPDNSKEKVGLDDYLLKFPEDQRSNELRKLIESKIDINNTNLREMKKGTKEHLKQKAIEKRIEERTLNPNYGIDWDEDEPAVKAIVADLMSKHHYIAEERLAKINLYRYGDHIYGHMSEFELRNFITQVGLDPVGISARRTKAYKDLTDKCFMKTVPWYENFTPYQIPLRDCIYDCLNDKKIEFSKDDYVYHKIDLPFIPEKEYETPYWNDHILKIYCTNNEGEYDPDKEAFLYEIIGFYLTPRYKIKKFITFQGNQDTGKTVIGQFLCDLIGAEHTTSIDLCKLSESFGKEMLPQKFLAFDSEPRGEKDTIDGAELKRIKRIRLPKKIEIRHN